MRELKTEYERMSRDEKREFWVFFVVALLSIVGLFGISMYTMTH